MDLDEILLSIGGWGYFQTFTYFSLCLVVIFSVFPMSYIFVARDTKYRCRIDNCDQKLSLYQPEWLKNAVPYNNGVPSRCLYYKPSTNNSCTSFDKNVTLQCDHFIFERNQTTIVQDFNITCDENLWKLTMVGTINVLGELFCLPFTGFLSDRFGRRNMIIISIFLSTIIGLVRSFSLSYHMYITLEFLDTALGSGMYSGAFILALEIVDSKKRKFGNTIICCAFALGQIVLGVSAWLSPTWRIMIRILYSSGFFIALTLLFVPESVRWLLSKKQTDKARNVLKRIAKINGTNFREDMIVEFPRITSCENQNKKVFSVLKNKTLLLRTLHCSYTWICCNFPYYGLTIQAVALSEDIYLNFICTALIEIPAYLATQALIDRFGRRKTIAFSLILAGISCISVNLVDPKSAWLPLVVFLSGKFFITVSYTTLYIYTAEMFPTESRHFILAICSMFGRLGSIMAPQVPLLARLFSSLPLIIFSAMALSSGFLAFWFPETLNTKLPDKISEAVNIEEANS